MPTYASGTTVSASDSRADIERTLQRYGAGDFAYMSKRDQAAIMFEMENRRIRFILPMPDPDSREFTEHTRGRRTPDAAQKLWEQATRQRWRALLLVIKAKLEAVEAGISVFEEEFGMNIVLPDGRTVYEATRPAIQEAYENPSRPFRPMLELGQ